MTKPNCLVLGGCGFLGSYVAESLLTSGSRVRIFDRLHVNTENIDGFKDGIELVHGDLNNQKNLEACLEGIDYVFHFASTTIPQTATENALFDLESNVGSIIRLLEIARKKKIKKIIYSSSGGTVYGIPKKIPLKEDHPTDPISAYGVSKLAIEKYFKLYSHLYGIDHLILRLSNPYGPRQNVANPQGAIVHFLNSILNEKTIEVWGDGSVVRDYFFVRDLLGLFPKLLSDKHKNAIFNVGYGKGHDLNDVLGSIERVIGRKPKVKYIAGRKLDVPINVLHMGKTKKELRWHPETKLEAGIRQTWLWLAEKRASEAHPV
jgi:UDP-glucose 4-epimerase